MNKLFNCCIIFFFCSGVSFAYTPPIGIPNPGPWGTTHPIDSSAPDTSIKCPNWPSGQTTGCFYIDNTHPQATDTANSLGYPNKPRMTFPTYSFSAGEYIELHGGPYSITPTFNVAGTVENPVWLRGSLENMPTITGSFNTGNTTAKSVYFYLEYLDFNGGNNGCITISGPDSHNILIRNSKFRNRTWTSSTSGVAISPPANGTIKDVVIYNNEFSELGDWQELSDQDFHGINPNTYGKSPPTALFNVWMLNNSFYHLSGNGVQVNGNSEAMIDNLHHVYIGKNTGHACRQAILWSKQASHVIMSQNIAYDNRVHGSQPGNGIGYQYNPDNLWIIFNEIFDSSNGIRQSDTSIADLTHNTYIIGNKIYNIHPGIGEAYDPVHSYRPGQAIALWQGGENRYIIDNTIYDVHGGIMITQNGPVQASGNIISSIHDEDFHIYNLNARTPGVVTFNNDLFFDSGGTFRAQWSSLYTSLSSFQSATSTCTNCIVADPEFVDAGNNNFHVAEGSPAIGQNSRHIVYDTFETLYGLSIAYDFNGNRRPETGLWTLGAYEYTAGPTGRINSGTGTIQTGTGTWQ